MVCQELRAVLIIVKYIQLSNSKEKCMVDDEDHGWVLIYDNWDLMNKGYAFGTRNRKLMHRIIYYKYNIKKHDKEVLDHKDGDRLNNQKSNLRSCFQCENARNSKIPKTNKSGYKGVFEDKRCGQWSSYITFNKQRITIGYFDDKKDAAIAYDIMAKKLFGVFAKCNFDFINELDEKRIYDVINAVKQRIGTSKYKGVSWDKIAQKWKSQITHNKKVYNLGRYATEKEAAIAYDKKCKELFGGSIKNNQQPRFL